MAYKLMFTLILMTFSVCMVKSQMNFNYKPGLIITNDNDTLYGLLRDRGVYRNSKACIFKEDKKSKPVKYFPGDISSYIFTGEKYYQSAEVLIDNEHKKLFLDVLLKGKLSLYYYWKNKDRNFYIQKDDSELIGLTNERTKIEEVENIHISRSPYSRQYVYENLEYKDTLRSIFGDSRKMQNQIHNVAYNKKSLISITQGYLEETYGKNSIHYIRDLNLAKPQIGLYSGFSFNRIFFLTYRNDKDLPANELNLSSDLLISYPIGIFMGFPLKIVNEKLVFQTELNTTHTKFNREFYDSSPYNHVEIDYRQIGLAFLLKYEMFQNRFISPSLGFGKNISFAVSPKVLIDDMERITLHSTQKGGWFLELGMDYKFSPKFSLFSNFRIHSLNNIVVNNSDKGVYYKTVLSNFAYPLEYKTNVGSVLIGVKF